MTLEDYEKTWGAKIADRDYYFDIEELFMMKQDAFEMYEETGFIEKFDSPYEELGKNGMSFKVIRRGSETLDQIDLENLPMWLIEFENGEQAFCYPEEICKVEHQN